MRERLPHLTLAILFVLLFAGTTYSQETLSKVDKILNLPDKVFSKVDKQTQALEQKLVSQTEKYLKKLEKQELKLKRKLWKQDSTKAKETFGDVKNRYQALRNQLHTKEQQAQSYTSSYSGHSDSLTTAIKFLKENPFLKEGGAVANKITSNFKSVTDLQNKLNQTENIRNQIKAQQEKLKQQLQNTGLAKEFLKYKKQVYYYQAQLKEYKDALNDPEKLGNKLIEVALKFPAFKEFFRENAQLASLFRIPGGDPASTASFAGLQTRVDVQSMLQQSIGTSPDAQQYVQTQIQTAQQQVLQLKNKLNNWGTGDDVEMPDFKTNSQKTKSIVQRIELGSTVQTVKGNLYFPVTTDLGLTAGYKLNDKSIVGVGVSYKMGWGQNWENINITHQGAGFRTFIDWKAPFGSPKGGMLSNIWISGGGEMNYRSAFRNIEVLKNLSAWQTSALLGVSKVVSIKSNFFKKTKVQLLYDFLWKQQQPQTQSLLFRIGYNF